MHILLIEPDGILANIYKKALKNANYTVVSVSSAQAAVHAADERVPDLVLLELQLPNHNGVEFLYEFRSYSEWLQIPVIIHSYVPPHEYDHAATLSLELGVARCLHKQTTSLRQLIAAVAAVTQAAETIVIV